MKHECVVCGAQFEIKLEDDDFEVRFCPCCGNEMMEDLEIVEHIDPEMLYDEFDDL